MGKGLIAFTDVPGPPLPEDGGEVVHRRETRGGLDLLLLVLREPGSRRCRSCGPRKAKVCREEP